MVANEEMQTSPLASTTLEAWATTPSTWREKSVIEFRVRRQGQPTRRLRLPGARYTLGSGSASSIQLEDASLRPLHAVLIRDEERILVRAYSVPFQINSHRVSEGLLRAGDRLRLGEYELELLDGNSKSATQTFEAATLTDCGGADASGSFHEEAKQWRALKLDTQRREAWCESREQELNEQQAALKERMDTLQKREAELQLQESAAAEVHGEFHAHYQELLQRRDELRRQHDELASGRERLRLQQERLDGRDQLHRQQIDKLIREQEQFKKMEVLSQQKLAESEAQHRKSRQQADAATSAVAQMREKFALLSEQLLQLSEHQASLRQLDAKRNAEHRHQTDELELERDEALAQRDYIAAQRDQLATQRDEVMTQRDAVIAHRDDLIIQRNDLTAERDDIVIERDEIAACCRELELIQDQLRADIEELQCEIATTRLHAESLDQECQAAHDTITSLEDTVREQNDRYDIDRQAWSDEIGSLCKNIDDLSVELETAQSQLSKIREDNELLAEQLTGVTDQRDQACAERAVAIEQCKAAQHECKIAQTACDAARNDCEAARRDLETARLEVKLAREERDVAAAHRDQILAQRDTQAAKHDELISDQAAWAEQKSQAERRFQESRSHLTDAREKCERAVRARDEAESARHAAEEKLIAANAELHAMQVERDEAIADQETMRRQRDSAIQDAKDTRELFDRCNREHDDTLELIERLEQKTREVMGDFVPEHSSPEPARLSLLDHEQSSAYEEFDTQEVWPTYASEEKKPFDALELPNVPASNVSLTSDQDVDEELAQPSEPAYAPTLSTVAINDSLTDHENGAAGEASAAEDDSIEAYMNRLLQRVQGRITNAVPVVAGAAQEDEEEQDQSDAAMTAALANVTEPVQEAPTPKLGPKAKQEPPKLPPTAVMPNKPSTKQSASRSPKSRGKVFPSRAMMKYAQTGFAVTCGIVAVVLVSLPMLKIVAALAALLIAVISAKEAHEIKSEFVSPRSSRRTPTADAVMPKAVA